MPAYSVHVDDPYEPSAVIVFAKSNIEARRQGASQLDCDEIGGLRCLREPWADAFEINRKIPAAEMLAHGWMLPCAGCEQIISDGGTVTRYNDDGQETEVDVDPVGTDHCAFCTPECKARHDEYRARCKRGERRFWAALAREALRKFPGITIDPEKTDAARWSGHHHRYFGTHSKSGRCRALCFVVAFSFPGSKYGGKYRYDLDYEATKGRRSLLIANGDLDAWNAFRSVMPPWRPRLP